MFTILSHSESNNSRRYEYIFRMKVLLVLCTVLVSTVSEETLYDCGRLCKCEFYPRDTIVKCMGAHIHEIPKHLPRNTTKL